MSTLPSPLTACQLTPPGRSAVSVIEIQGSGAAEALDRCFASMRSASCRDLPLGRVNYGHWRKEHGIGEDVVVVRVAEDRFEVHGHGGITAPQQILGSLAKAGCRVVSPWQRMLEASKSTIAAEAKWLMARSPGRPAAQLCQSQIVFDGQGMVEQWRELLTSHEKSGVSKIIERIREVLTRKQLARKAFEGPVVILVGPANAGKSSLLNALVGYERAIVFDQPGTTRDLVQSTIIIDGWPVTLVDTAGERDEVESELEREGQTRAQQVARRADLILRLVDVQQGELTNGTLGCNKGMGDPETWLIVSKRDRISDEQLVRSRAQLEASGTPYLFTSTVQEGGLIQLWDRLRTWTTNGESAIEGLVPLTARQTSCLESSLEYLERGLLDEATDCWSRLLKDREASEPVLA